MGYSQVLKDMARDSQAVVTRNAQTYTAAAFDIFDIIGAVYIVCLGGIVTGAAVGGTQIRLTVNGVNADAAAVAIDGAVGTVFLSSLNVAGTLINAEAIPETVATHSRMLVGIQAAAVGVIAATFSVGTSWTGQIFCIYTRLTPQSSIVNS